MAGRDKELRKNALDIAESSTDISERSVDGTHEKEDMSRRFSDPMSSSGQKVGLVPVGVHVLTRRTWSQP